MACRFRSAAIMGRRSGRAAQAVLRACRRGGSSSASSRTSSIRPRRKRMADMSACIARSRHRRRAQPRRTRPNSKPASTPSAGTTTRSARTKRWANDPRTNSTCHRSDPCRIALRTLGTTPITRSAACVPRARSCGKVTVSSSAKYWLASSWASPNSRPATMSCASTTATWGSSIAVAASPGSLRPVRGSANRPNRPQTPNCRVSSRSKVSTINPGTSWRTTSRATTTTPLPSPPPQGGREQTEFAACLIPSNGHARA